jgi:hypothetical protein
MFASVFRVEVSQVGMLVGFMGRVPSGNRETEEALKVATSKESAVKSQGQRKA